MALLLSLVDMTLDVDPLATHHLLRTSSISTSVPRFSCSVCILGSPWITFGHHYSKVDLGRSPGWTLECAGICSPTNKRGLPAVLGSWTLSLRKGRDFLVGTPTGHFLGDGKWRHLCLGTGDASHILTFAKVSLLEPPHYSFWPS